MVLFVMDLTGECGTKVGDQLRIREELRQRFPEKAQNGWVDVFTKADMFAEEEEGEGEGGKQQDGAFVIEGCRDEKYHVDSEFLDAEYALALAQVPGALWVSTHTGLNVDALKRTMLDAL